MGKQSQPLHHPNPITTVTLPTTPEMPLRCHYDHQSAQGPGEGDHASVWRKHLQAAQVCIPGSLWPLPFEHWACRHGEPLPGVALQSQCQAVQSCSSRSLPWCQHNKKRGTVVILNAHSTQASGAAPRPGFGPGGFQRDGQVHGAEDLGREAEAQPWQVQCEFSRGVVFLGLLRMRVWCSQDWWPRLAQGPPSFLRCVVAMYSDMSLCCLHQCMPL